MKATFEQAFKNRVGGSGSGSGSAGSSGSSASQERAPWALSYQMSERYSLLWNDDLKARLLKVCPARPCGRLLHAFISPFTASILSGSQLPTSPWPALLHPQRKAAEQLGMSDEELEERLQRLLLLLPDIRQKLASMRPQLVAALAAQVDEMPGAPGEQEPCSGGVVGARQIGVAECFCSSRHEQMSACRRQAGRTVLAPLGCRPPHAAENDLPWGQLLAAGHAAARAGAGV